jgi:putative ABC transport system ATP-binding protein
MKQVTIECNNITKSFAGPTADALTLRGISFTAHEDEMIMLMGPSGSGKTTLISIVGGILKQDSGSCIVLGKDINNLPENEKTAFRGKNIGFIFQSFNLVPTLTAVENVAIPLLIANIDSKRAYAKAEELLLDFGLDEQRYRKPNKLSGGEQQRVAIARACIHKPRIILCDEPTSFLDRERGRSIMELLRKIKIENNCTLILVTHDPRILDFADRILEIEDGMIKTESNHQT